MGGPAPVVLYALTGGVDMQQLLDAWAGELTEEEGTHIARLRQEHDRRDYLAAHVLRRLALREAPGSSHSITHANGLVACATMPPGAGSVGIDAERRDSEPRLATMADVVASQSERDQLDLVTIWVAKEAYLKQIGEGFSGGTGYGVLRALNAAPDGTADGWVAVRVHDTRRGRHVRAWTKDVGDHLIAVVGSPDGAGRFEERTLS